MADKIMVCELCGCACKRNGAMQKYCQPCSKERDLERKRIRAAKTKVASSAVQEATRAAGVDLTDKSPLTVMLDQSDKYTVSWSVRFKIPFTYAGSKNHIWSTRQDGHVYQRKSVKDLKALIAALTRRRVADMPVVQNKVWIEMFIQKPNQRGDAINFVDIICDGIKDGLGVDDRWFSIRHLDWEVCKDNPEIMIGIGQEADYDARVCSSCGRILRYEKFAKNKSMKAGIQRNCKECRTAGRKISRANK